MKTLEIKKGQEFKIHFVEKINENDIFIDEYYKAANKLNDVCGSFATTDEKHYNFQGINQYENNIIAFCGQRGAGKSSIMLSFCNEIMMNREVTMLKLSNDVKKAYIAPIIAVDPSMFDDIHNILDIVIASMYSKFIKMSQKSSKEDIIKLKGQFQKVYRYLSLLNNSSKILDDEYDYEGNIGKISRMGESLRLQVEMKELVREYIEFIRVQEAKENDHIKDKTKNDFLIIAIDDLDLCSTNAYKMAEQIRKYLMIPNVVIIMAVKIEQLALCVEEKNISDFKLLANRDLEMIKEETNQMTNRYLAKLIPEARRIHIPNVVISKDVEVKYINSNKAEEDLIFGKNYAKAVYKLVFDKTGIIMYSDENDANYFIPTDLRGYINLISMLDGMKDITKSIHATNFAEINENEREEQRQVNIQQLLMLFKQVWIENNEIRLKPSVLDELLNKNLFIINKYLERYIQGDKKTVEGDKKIVDSYSSVAKFLVEDELDNEEMFFAIRFIYTMRMNLNSSNLDSIAKFVDGKIWGEDLQNILRSNQSGLERASFSLDTKIALKIIANQLNIDFPEGIINDGESRYSIAISKVNDKEKITKLLVILSLLSDSKSKSSLFSGNNSVAKTVKIGLDFYMVNLLGLGQLLEKSGLQYPSIFKEATKYINIIKNNNNDLIKSLFVLISNLDTFLKIKDYCLKYYDYKEEVKNEPDTDVRTEKIIDRFFNNINKGMMIIEEENNFQIFKREKNDLNEILQWNVLVIDKQVSLNVSKLYAKMYFEAENSKVNVLEEKVNEFQKILVNNNIKGAIVVIPKTLRLGKCEKIAFNLENIARNIAIRRTTLVKKNIIMEEDDLKDIYNNMVNFYSKMLSDSIREQQFTKDDIAYYKEFASLWNDRFIKEE